MDDFLNPQEVLQIDVDQVHNATNKLAHAVSSLRSFGDIDYAHYSQQLDATNTSAAVLVLQNFLPEYRKKLAQ